MMGSLGHKCMAKADSFRQLYISSGLPRLETWNA